MQILIDHRAPRFHKYGKLPGRPSDLIELAVNDLANAERRAGTRINMGSWMVNNIREKKCSVCFAGAVMACTLKNARPVKNILAGKFPDGSKPEPDWDGTVRLTEVELEPSDFDNENDALEALNYFREGKLEEAFDALNLELPPHFESQVDVVGYSDTTKGTFKRQMRALARALREQGY